MIAMCSIFQKVNVAVLFIAAISSLTCTRKIVSNNGKVALQFDSIRVVTIDQGPYMIGPCEPSISVSPVDQNRVVAGSVLDNYYVSGDGGKSWKKGKLKSAFGVYGDPVVKHTSTGRVLYGHLSNPMGKAYSSDEFLDRIVVQMSDDDGASWFEGSFPPCNYKTDHDKHWISADPSSRSVLMSWTEFDKYGSKELTDKSRILFSVSHDNGDTWSDALSISQIEGDCLDDDKTTEGAVPVVGVDGNYYVVWSHDSKIYLDKSTDRGKTWMTEDKVIASQPGGWSLDIPGIDRCNGMPVIKSDHSRSKYRGNLYVSWADQRSGANDTDIWCMSSPDGGKMWSQPVRVNNDPAGKHQFFSAMDVDQATGIIYFVFYDRRAYDTNYTDVWMAYSTDGGKTFENIKISEKPFLPEPTVFFGDYNDISAINGIIRPIWTEQDGVRLKVKTAIVNVRK